MGSRQGQYKLTDALCVHTAMDNDDDEDSLGQAAIQQIQSSSKRIAEANKEWFSAMTKYSKSVEKVSVYSRITSDPFD